MIVEVKVPSPGESITEVEIETWLVESGAQVGMDDELAEINSDKATLTVNAPSAGIIEILAAAGETVAVGQVIARINPSGSAAAPRTEPKAEAQPPVQQSAEAPAAESFAKGHPLPAAEKLMKEQGVDPASVSGSGRGGRITKTDVLDAASRQPAVTPVPQPPAKEPAPKQETPLPALPAAGSSAARTDHREKMTAIRRKIAQRLVSAKNDTAMLTTFNEVDMHAIMELRKKYKDKFKEVHGVGLGFMSFFTKACTMALMEFPRVNGQIHGEEIVTFSYADIGIAVSTDRGLVVPVIRNAHLMSFAEIEQAVLHFGLKARDNKITIQDMEGGTFSITNGGIFGSMLSTPILNPPQSAILGMHNIVERPVAIGGEVKIRPVMYLALSYDHRIIDGKEAVSFLVRVKERLEDPQRLLLGL
ncbi:MAG: 2-oxoglutarate dehydrogenase complex dihydrolipoyllysine-residue succinyltransferase [Bacteroidia bacterium]|nr:2-oxoglutarate dehydrogenase complex dihydrolipoyllysine-residue succinyltransferase [Bacteroidia bacterium]